jgi:hypothetical protein
VVTKRTLDVRKKMDFFFATTGNGWSQNRLLTSRRKKMDFFSATTGNGWSQNRLLTSGTRVFYPVNTGIGSSVFIKGLLTFVPCVFFLRKRMDFFFATTGNAWSQNRLLTSRRKNGLFLCHHRKRVVTKQTLDVRNSCLLPC